MQPISLDDEYSHYLQCAAEERERRRAEREAHVPEPEPSLSLITQWPAGEKRITVQAAAWLLQVQCCPPLNTKPNDSALRREITKNTTGKSLERFEELILQRAREDLIDLIDPILERPIARPANPDRYWLIGLEAYETIKNTLLGSSAATSSDTAAATGKSDGASASTRLSDSSVAAPTPNALYGAAAPAVPASAPSVPNTLSERPGGELKQAPDDQIHQAITAVYDAADEAGEKPPNIKQIAEPVVRRLMAAGYTASGAQIGRLADADPHKKRRRLPGKTLASEKARFRDSRFRAF